MATLRIFIEMDNEAFAESETQEVARILRKFSDIITDNGYRIECYDGDKLHDINGNTVGQIKVID
jgi:hypothetical protein